MTDSEETQESLAETIRSINTHGQEKQWEPALREALKCCDDYNKLTQFAAESDKDSDQTAIVGTLQRRASFASYIGSYTPRLVFEARCGHALGRNSNTLRLVEVDVLAYIRRLSQLAEWNFQMATSIIHLENQKTEVIYPDTIEISGTLNRYNSTLSSEVLILRNLNENEKQVREAWAKLEKPEGSKCIVRLVVDGVPRYIPLS